MPRFTFTEGTSSKYWKIEIEDDTIELTWGRIGTGGTTKQKKFDDSWKARKEYEKLIEAKLAEGYSPDGVEGHNDLRAGLRCVACGGPCEEWIKVPGVRHDKPRRKTGVLEVQCVYGAAAGGDSHIFCPTCSPLAEAMLGGMIEAVKMAAADRKALEDENARRPAP